MVTKEQFLKRNSGVIDRTIRKRLGNTGRVIHGGKAQNAQMPRFLNRPTKDWDVFAKNPKRAAEQLEKILDKKFRGDFFSVKEGATKRVKVHKVISNVDKRGIVDFSVPDRKVPIISKRRIRMATLKDQKQKAQSNLKKKSTIFRRDKDKDLLKRIKQFEKLRGKKI